MQVLAGRKRSISGRLHDIQQQRTQSAPPANAIIPDQWKKIDPKKERYDERKIASEFIVFNKRKTTPVKLFNTFLDETLLGEIWDAGISANRNTWSFEIGCRTVNGGVFELPFIHRVLAIKVYIYGLGQLSNDMKEGGRPLRNGIERARSHFVETFPDAEPPPGIKVCEHMLAHFLLSHEFTDHLCRNFRSIIKSIGEYVAGDEKLFYFTGNSGNIRLVITKPDRIGLWFYELCGAITTCKSYLLDLKLWSVRKEWGQTEHVADVIKDWCEVIAELSHKKLPVLCFDSHYMSAAARRHLIEYGFCYFGAASSDRFTDLQHKVRFDVTKPGQWAGLWNEETKELYVLCWDRDSNIGKKQVVTSAMKRMGGYVQPKQLIPAYDLYKVLFSACDHFNKDLSGHTWPMKHGGKGTVGDLGAEDDFAFASLLQNVHDADHEINKREGEALDFYEFFFELADQLYKS